MPFHFALNCDLNKSLLTTTKGITVIIPVKKRRKICMPRLDPIMVLITMAIDTWLPNRIASLMTSPE